MRRWVSAFAVRCVGVHWQAAAGHPPAHHNAQLCTFTGAVGGWADHCYLIDTGSLECSTAGQSPPWRYSHPLTRYALTSRFLGKLDFWLTSKMEIKHVTSKECPRSKLSQIRSWSRSGESKGGRSTHLCVSVRLTNVSTRKMWAHILADLDLTLDPVIQRNKQVKWMLWPMPRLLVDSLL